MPIGRSADDQDRRIGQDTRDRHQQHDGEAHGDSGAIDPFRPISGVLLVRADRDAEAALSFAFELHISPGYWRAARHTGNEK